MLSGRKLVLYSMTLIVVGAHPHPLWAGLPTFKGIWTWKVRHLRIRPSVPYFPLYVYQLKLVTKPLMQNKDNKKVYNYFQSSLKSIKMQVNWNSTRLAGMKPRVGAPQTRPGGVHLPWQPLGGRGKM